MLAVGNAAYLLVVVRAAVPGVDDHRHAGEGAQYLQALDQVRVQLQPATTATFKFFARKVQTQIALPTKLQRENICRSRLAKSEYDGKVTNHHAGCAPSQRELSRLRRTKKHQLGAGRNRVAKRYNRPRPRQAQTSSTSLIFMAISCCPKKIARSIRAT
jgi:hypothetical protein